MAPTIRIDDEVFEALQKQAEPLVDSPNDVLRRVFGLNNTKHHKATGHEEAAVTQRTVRDIVEQCIGQYEELELNETNATFIRFASRSWTSPHLRRGTEKSGRIIWFLFENRPKDKRLTLSLEIGPGDPETRSRICEAVRECNWFTGRKELSPKFARVSRTRFLGKSDYEEHGGDMRWIEDRIRERMEDFMASEFKQIDQVITDISF